ncbi:alpha/beta fold hydrolase [Micromonospora sp. NPDC000089]|uniref:alpha/beta fold hydrolase n=1 Tax=unclassified Micromonospora TaxID=2617518 RepID=UPI003687F196
MTTTRHTVLLDGTGPVDLIETGSPDGRPVLLLHGGAGPQSMEALVALLADEPGVRVVAPIHPGFGGTPRPETVSSVGDLARLYAALLDQLDLRDVTLVGNSVGGWVAAELALLGSPRIGRLVLIDAVGIDVPGHPVADFFNLTMDEVFDRSFHDPTAFRFDPAGLPPAAQAVAAGNRAALAAYAGGGMSDPGLRPRLGALTLPVLVLWGESDEVVDQDYGRAYAEAVPTARFELLPRTGHLPQMETPELALAALRTVLDPADR